MDQARGGAEIEVVAKAPHVAAAFSGLHHPVVGLASIAIQFLGNSRVNGRG
jgi:hypothetical protein